MAGNETFKNYLTKIINIELLDKQYENILNVSVDEIQKSIFDNFGKSKYVERIINNYSRYLTNDDLTDCYFIYKFHEKIINIYKSDEKIFSDLLDLYNAFNEGVKFFNETHITTYFITFEKIRHICECVKSDCERLGIKLIKRDGPLVDVDKIGNYSDNLMIDVNKIINDGVKTLINAFDIKENKFISNYIEIQDVMDLLIDFLKGEDGPMSLLNLRIERIKNKINEVIDEVRTSVNTNDVGTVYSQCYDKLKRIDRLICTFSDLNNLYKQIKIEYIKYKTGGKN